MLQGECIAIVIQCDSISIQTEFQIRDESVRSSSGHLLRRIFVAKGQYEIVFRIGQLLAFAER